MTGSENGRVLVSRDTLNRDTVVRDFVDGRLSRKEAAAALGKSERQISRMITRWRSKGVLGLEHGLVGSRANHRIDDELREKVLKLLAGKYSGFNLRHFHEYLIEKEKVVGISYPSIKRLARAAGIGRSKKRRSTVRRRRQRFAQAGYMLQMDGSKHFWWKGKECCLIAGIDDATSDVPYGEFSETETLEGYMRVLRRIVELKGVPRIIYVDKATWLGGLSEQENSQFHRMCEELGARVIHAESAEAKGRIERFWGTTQDRLVSELRLNGVVSILQANSYFNDRFLPDTWQKKFTVTPENSGILYLPRPRSQELDQIFCLKFDRKIRKDHTVLFDNEVLGITANLTHSIARKNAEIRIYSDGRLRGFYGGKDLALRMERKGCWGRYDKQNIPSGLTTWRKEVGGNFQ